MWAGALARVHAGGLLKGSLGPSALWALCASRRWGSTAPRSEAWRLHKDHLELRYADTCMRFGFVWLRDHCRSNSCYNSKTKQRILDTSSVNLDIRPRDVQVDESTVRLTWPDGHVTVHRLDWLMENSYEEQQKKSRMRSLWNLEVYQSAHIAPVHFHRILETDEGLKELLQNILLYGIAFVDGVPPTEESTERVAQRVSLIRDTYYGRPWFIANDYSREDIGFSSGALKLHNDGTYMEEPWSIETFHCLSHDGEGGQTLLVDGFYAAEKLRQQTPEDFELLSNVLVRHDYIEVENGIHMCAEVPVLNINAVTQELCMIRYNNYDRSSLLSVPYDVAQRWYAAHRRLTAEICRPENKLLVKLNPGMMLFFDNWRILHGRESFTGSRKLFGFALLRDDMLSKARWLGLLA